MKAHKIFIGSLLLAFVFTVSLLPATPASAIIVGQTDENRHPYVGALAKCAWLPRATKDRYIAKLKAYAG